MNRGLVSHVNGVRKTVRNTLVDLNFAVYQEVGDEASMWARRSHCALDQAQRARDIMQGSRNLELPKASRQTGRPRSESTYLALTASNEYVGENL